MELAGHSLDDLEEELATALDHIRMVQAEAGDEVEELLAVTDVPGHVREALDGKVLDVLLGTALVHDGHDEVQDERKVLLQVLLEVLEEVGEAEQGPLDDLRVLVLDERGQLVQDLGQPLAEVLLEFLGQDYDESGRGGVVRGGG